MTGVSDRALDTQSATRFVPPVGLKKISYTFILHTSQNSFTGLALPAERRGLVFLVRTG